MKKIICFVLVLLFLPMDLFLVSSASKHDPYAGIEMINYDDAVGVSSIFSKDIERSLVRNLTGASAYLVFKDVDFGSVAPEFIEAYCGVDEANAGTVEIRIDQPNGPAIATINVVPGAWSIAVPSTVKLEQKLTGVHDLYVRNIKKVCNLFKIVFYQPIKENKGYVKYEEKRYFSDIADNPCEDEIYTLIGLGLLEGFSESRYEPALAISRGDYAQILYKILNNMEYFPQTEVFFDVPQENKNFTAISYLYDNKVIGGTQGSLFKPHEYISVTDAVTMAVRALGFEKIAKIKGGYPIGYLTVANEEGLLKGVGGGELLRRDFLARLVFNMINADFLDYGTIGSEGVNYERKAGVLSETQHIYKGSGIVGATNFTNLVSPLSSLDAEQVTIGGVNFWVGGTSAISLLGYETNYYYEKKNEEFTLVYIRPKKSVSTLSFNNPKDIVRFDEGGLTYISENGTQKTIQFSKNTKFIYNGIAIDAALSNIMNPDFRGDICYVENSNDQSTVLINEYVNVLVGALDSVDQIVYDKDTNESLEINKEKGNVFIYKDAAAAGFRDIKPGMVLTIYQSKNKKGKTYSRVIIETKTVDGTITEVGEDQVVIEGKPYGVAQSGNKVFYPGLSAKFHLNHANEIVTYIIEDAVEDTVALLLDYHAGNNSSINLSAEIKVFNKEGKTVVYPCAAAVIMDGVKCEKTEQMINGRGAFTGLKNIAKHTLVRYKLNDHGEIVLLDTCSEGAKNSNDRLTKLSDSRTLYYLNPQLRSLVLSGGKNAFPYEAEPQVFSFWVEGDEESLHYNDKLSTDTYTEISVDADVYTLDSEGRYAQYVVWYGRGNTVKWKSPLTFDRMNSYIDEKGEEGYKIYCMNGSSELQYTVTKAWLDLLKNASLKELLTKAQKGDVMRFKFFPDNRVYDGQLIFQHNGDITLGSLSTFVNQNIGLYGTDTFQYTRFIYGTVTEKFGDFIKVKYENHKDGSIVQGEEMVYFNGQIVKYDYNNGEFRLEKGLAANNLLLGDTVLVCINDRVVSQIVVYNRPNE